MSLSHPRIGLATLLTSLVLAAGILAAVPVRAEVGATGTAAGPDYFAAMSLSVDKAAGYSYNYRRLEPSQKRAFQECRKRSNYPGYCRRIGWVKNGCGAVAIKTDDRGFVTEYQFGWAATKRGAKRNARKNFGGKIHGYVCTAR